MLLALVLSAGARANGIIDDPSMRVEEGDFSTAISEGSTFTADDNGGGIVDFYNPLSVDITALSIDAYILPDLTYVVDSPQQVQIAGYTFQCNAGAGNPFFENCSIQYVPLTGEMSISYWGSGVVGFQSWNGIAPLPSGCSSDPDLVPTCTDSGHFYIDLNNGTSTPGLDSGGWIDNSTLFLAPAGPTFVATYSTLYGATPETLSDTPEPAVFVLVGSALIGLGFAVRRRSRAATSRADGRKPPVSARPGAAPPA